MKKCFFSALVATFFVAAATASAQRHPAPPPASMHPLFNEPLETQAPPAPSTSTQSYASVVNYVTQSLKRAFGRMTYTVTTNSTRGTHTVKEIDKYEAVSNPRILRGQRLAFDRQVMDYSERHITHSYGEKENLSDRTTEYFSVVLPLASIDLNGIRIEQWTPSEIGPVYAADTVSHINRGNNTVVTIRSFVGKSTFQQFWLYSKTDGNDYFYRFRKPEEINPCVIVFPDRDSASRFANALTQLALICGAEKDVFGEEKPPNSPDSSAPWEQPFKDKTP